MITTGPVLRGPETASRDPRGSSDLKTGGDGLAEWAARTGRRRDAEPGRDGLRFAFYGRVSTEDWQDPVSSRARQLTQAQSLVAGHGRITAEYFDAGQSRVLPWARRPQAAALLAAMADPDRGFDAVVVCEYALDGYDLRLAAVTSLWTSRFVAFDVALDRHHPAEVPHCHLAILAVHPDQQGQGIGTALLHVGHAKLDGEGTPAYLEAAGPRSRDLYLAHGYTDHGPPITARRSSYPKAS